MKDTFLDKVKYTVNLFPEMFYMVSTKSDVKILDICKFDLGNHDDYGTWIEIEKKDTTNERYIPR